MLDNRSTAFFLVQGPDWKRVSETTPSA